MLFMLGSTLSTVFSVILSSRAQLTIFLAPPICATYSTRNIDLTLDIYYPLLRLLTTLSLLDHSPPDSCLALHDTTLFFGLY